MIVLKHFLYSGVSRLKMQNVKNEYLLINRNTKEISQNFRKIKNIQIILDIN